jgi:hypothetical protein
MGCCALHGHPNERQKLTRHPLRPLGFSALREIFAPEYPCSADREYLFGWRGSSRFESLRGSQPRNRPIPTCSASPKANVMPFSREP